NSLHAASVFGSLAARLHGDHDDRVLAAARRWFAFGYRCSGIGWCCAGCDAAQLFAGLALLCPLASVGICPADRRYAIPCNDLALGASVLSRRACALEGPRLPADRMKHVQACTIPAFRPRGSMTLRTIALLGATGSVGTSTLDVIARHRDRFHVGGVAAH